MFVCNKVIISDNKEGFIKDCSCQTNLFLFYEEINEKLDGGSSVLHLEFAKALDTVPPTFHL